MNATTCSYNAIFGEFNSQGIFIDMENNSEDWNVFSTSVHESTHSFIEFDSYLGQLEFLMQQIILSPQTDINTRERFKSFIEIIFDNSINVQESVAVFWELSYLESYNAELMDKEWELYKTKRPDYYIKYHFKDLEDFLDDAFDRYKFKPTEEQIKNKAENILLLAKYCMNIDITKLNFMGTSALSSITKDKPSFNPNYRFDKTIKYIKNNKISIYDLSKSVIEQIFDKLNFPYLHAFEVDFMSNWANNNLLSQYNLNNYSYYVAYEKIENPLEYILSINCYISERKYLGKIVSNPSETDIANAAFYAYVCDNNDSPTPTALINVRNGEIIYIKKDYNPNLALKIGKVFTDRHSYPSLCNKTSIKPQIAIYIDLGNWDLIAKKFLNSQHLSGYIRYELNNNFSIILFKGEGNSVIYITLPTMNIPIFEACYLQNISLLNDWWQSSDDLLELYSFIMKTVKAHTSIKTNFVPQSYQTPSKKSLQSP